MTIDGHHIGQRRTESGHRHRLDVAYPGDVDGQCDVTSVVVGHTDIHSSDGVSSFALVLRLDRQHSLVPLELFLRRRAVPGGSTRRLDPVQSGNRVSGGRAA